MVDILFYFQEIWCSLKIFFSNVASNSVFQAVVGGTLVFVLGEMIQKLYVNPLTKYNDLRTEVCYCLVHYANAYMNPDIINGKITDWHKEAHDELRKVSSKVDAFSQEKKFLATRMIPSKERLHTVAGWLRGLSNRVTSNDIYRALDDNRRNQNAIRLYLNLDVEDYEGLDTWVPDKHFRRIAKKKMKKCKHL